MTRTWLVRRGGVTHGPLTDQQLKALASKGKLKETDQLSANGGDSWYLATSVKGLFSAASSAVAHSEPSPARASTQSTAVSDNTATASVGQSGPSETADSEEHESDDDDTLSRLLGSALAESSEWLKSNWVWAVPLFISVWCFVGPGGALWPTNYERWYCGHFRSGYVERFVSRVEENRYRIITVSNGRVVNDNVWKKERDNKGTWELSLDLTKPENRNVAAGTAWMTWQPYVSTTWTAQLISIATGYDVKRVVHQDYVVHISAMGRNFEDDANTSDWTKISSRTSP